MFAGKARAYQSGAPMDLLLTINLSYTLVKNARILVVQYRQDDAKIFSVNVIQYHLREDNLWLGNDDDNDEAQKLKLLPPFERCQKQTVGSK